MATKQNPGRWDCFTKAAPDEPMFVLLARDPSAPLLVELWARVREMMGDDPEQISEARDCVIAMQMWLVDHADEKKREKMLRVADIWGKFEFGESREEARKLARNLGEGHRRQSREAPFAERREDVVKEMIKECKEISSALEISVSSMETSVSNQPDEIANEIITATIVNIVGLLEVTKLGFLGVIKKDKP